MSSATALTTDYATSALNNSLFVSDNADSHVDYSLVYYYSSNLNVADIKSNAEIQAMHQKETSKNRLLDQNLPETEKYEAYNNGNSKRNNIDEALRLDLKVS